ncbi:hypothetical protein GCM10011575_15580 [Microlunatus endophyticus]|uniref:Membrane protein DUF2207 n=2 Tax=Microlunatus endophyticus TaxID=1716077 RepID=A0A917S6Z6_9ACTN|nr:hypothetical protein GCM10011575_15580 [Microlunatus endophyticus]
MLAAAAAAAGVLLLGQVVGGVVPTAHADGAASTVEVTSTLDSKGVLKVQEKITFSGSAPAQVQQSFETSESLIGNRSREFDLSGIGVTADAGTIRSSTSTDGDLTTLRFAPGSAKTATVSYTVAGAVISNGGNPTLHWRFLQGLSLSVRSFTAVVNIPGNFSYVNCTSGPPNTTTPCSSFSAGVGSQSPTFSDGPRGEGEVVAVEIGFPAGAVPITENIKEHWSFARAFSVKPLPLGLAIGLLVLGGIGLLAAHRRIGRDVAPSDEIRKPADFVPVGEGQSEFRVVGDIRPGHIGTVVDERVDPIDVTASLLDLAVRGHVLITELPTGSKYARTDWRLTRTPADQAPDDLRPFERVLLDTVAPAGEGTLVSELGHKVSGSVHLVQSELYDEMVENGWFQRRPDATRNTWTQAALAGLIAAAVITALLVIFTEFGLVGIALILLALGLMFIGQEMPARTAQGSALLAGLGALRSDLLTTPTDRMPPGRELSELSEVLPYAVVLGGAERWLDAIVAADDDDEPDSEDLSWYHGPSDWQLADLPHSLRNFIVTVNGTLFSR